MAETRSDLSPLISVIVPVYNGESYIQRCFDSILSQTYWNLELILCDDGSTDLSSEICDLYAKRDTRVHVIHQNNKGQAAARNRGLDESHGEFLMFVDSDDYLDENFIESLFDSIQTTGADMAGGRISLVEEEEILETLEPCVCSGKKQDNIDALMVSAL